MSLFNASMNYRIANEQGGEISGRLLAKAFKFALFLTSDNKPPMRYCISSPKLMASSLST